MNLRWVGTDDAACSAPGRLRHSWLDNQVLLVLRQASSANLKPAQLAPIVTSWRHDVADLLRYTVAFPDVVDPGVFLRRFANRKGLASNEAFCAALSARFETAFNDCMHLSIGVYRHELIAASEKFVAALDDLERFLGQCINDNTMSNAAMVALSTALETAVQVHRLLGDAPRGVCLL